MSGAPLRLLAVTHSLSGGGAERFVANLVNHLDRGRFAPAVCTATDRAGFPVAGDVPVASLGYRGLADLPRAVIRLRRRLTAEPPDLVLSNVLSTNGLTGAALALPGPRPPWVARIGNAPGIGEPLLQRLWARALYPRARLLVCNSRGIAGAMERFYPGSERRLRVLANPTDFARLDRLAAETPPLVAQEGELTLLWVGRLTPQKRPDLALEALARVRGERPARLWMVGEGPLRPAVERQAARLGLRDALELPGFLANPFPLYRQADLLLLTSDHEGLPNALIEAQGLGLPAVATRCPHGPDEIVDDGRTGRLVPPGDTAAIAAAVLELAAEGDRLRRAGKAAAALARSRFGLEHLLPSWQEMLEEAAA